MIGLRCAIKTKSTSLSERYYALCLQGNFLQALQAIQKAREYFRMSLLKEKQQSACDQWLFKRLCAVFDESGVQTKKMKNWDTLETHIRAVFARNGYRVLLGVVFPFRSLVVWKSQQKRTHSIRLPDGRVKIQVFYLDDFVELGWMHFATFGRHYIGGWAEKSRVTCVVPAWNLESDKFLVSFLAHEAQHFSDYRRYPQLLAPDLEYRAKLTELILSKRPSVQFRKFKKEARRSRKYPHSYGAFSILRNFSKRLDCDFESIKSGDFRISGRRLRELAMAAFEEHSAQLKCAGEKSVKTVL